MADLNVNSIGDASGGTTTTVNGFTPTVSNMAGRNRIINGDMRIDQRNAGASITPTTAAQAFAVDRTSVVVSQNSKLTAQQNAGSVTPPVGFTNYLGITSSSAYSVLTGDYFFINQSIEGFNVADFGWGTANAQTVTLSFWVRSSLTGTHSGSLRNGATNRSYVFTFSVSSANTWEYKTVTVAGDTSGTWQTGNGTGVYVGFNLGAGSTLTTTAGSWGAGNFTGATGATSVVGTSGATFYITGVQLEEGSVATPFEHRQYGQELALCQRYYQYHVQNEFLDGYNTTNGYIRSIMLLPCEMRATPTVVYQAGTLNANVTNNSISALSSSMVRHGIRVASTGRAYGDMDWFTLDAEL